MTTIHRAEISAWGERPKYATVPAPPSPGPDETQVRLLAAGVHRVVRTRASGKHYSANILPHIVGTDGVGVRVSDNKPVYFSAMGPQGGSMAEVLNVPTRATIELPEGSDAETVAAMTNPAMSSWMALKTRTEGLKEGFSVCILGVTTASGRVAATAVRQFGAGRVVGIARNEAAIKAIKGVDEAVVLKDKPEESDWSKVGAVDLVLDYLYGKPAFELIKSLPKGHKIQFVNIGGVAGEDMDLPSVLLRGKDITLRGSGPGAWTLQELAKESSGYVKVAAGLEKQKLRIEKLADIEKVWDETAGSDRLVIVP